MSAKGKFLLQKEFLNIKDIKEVLLLNGIELDVEQIFDWIEQRQELYIKAKDWTNAPLNFFTTIDDDFNEIRLTSFLEKDFLKIKYHIKEDRTFNNNYLEIAYTFIVHDYSIHRKGYESIYLKKIASSYDEMSNIFYTKATFVKDYLNSLETLKPKETIKEVEVTKEVEIIKEQPYLDTNHSYYSTELAVAIQVWNALYVDNGKYSIKKDSVANQSKKWIGDNYPHLDGDDKDIAHKKIQQFINYDSNKNKHKTPFRDGYQRKK